MISVLRAILYAAGLAACAVLLGASAPAVAAGCTEYGTPGCPYPSFGSSEDFRPDTNRPGSDYTSFDLNGAYPSDCRDACTKDGRCRSWTYVKPGVQGPKARCWLKSAVPAEQANNCCVSGVNAAVAPKPIKKLGKAMSAEAKAILNAHNAHRAKHCVPAMTWSSSLATAAAQWAKSCTPNGGGFAHSPGAWQSATGYGENLAWGTTLSGQGAVDLWYGEINQYNFGAPAWSGGVAHFTQVVWKGSKQLGCAVAACGGRSYWVCRYAPTGNWNVNNAGVLPENVPALCK